jgi:thioredoxin-like negative regulator of GroEL
LIICLFDYKIADNPEIAQTFGVTRRPFEVYMKNQKVVDAFAGIQPKDTFVNLINLYTQSATPESCIRSLRMVPQLN